MKEFLSTLNTRNKWVDQKRNVAPGMSYFSSTQVTQGANGL